MKCLNTHKTIKAEEFSYNWTTYDSFIQSDIVGFYCHIYDPRLD